MSARLPSLRLIQIIIQMSKLDITSTVGHFTIFFLSLSRALFSPLIQICSGLLFIYYAIFFYSLPSTNTRTGPCGGKTTGQSRMCTFFENLGWKVSINKCSIISRVRFSRLDYFVCFLYCTRVFYPVNSFTPSILLSHLFA